MKGFMPFIKPYCALALYLLHRKFLGQGEIKSVGWRLLFFIFLLDIDPGSGAKRYYTNPKSSTNGKPARGQELGYKFYKPAYDPIIGDS